jgi:cyanophycin synthetase
MELIKAIKKRILLPHCNDCGEMRVIHPLEKFLSWVESRMRYPTERVVPLHKIHAERRARLVSLFQHIGLLQVYTDSHHGTDSRIHALFEGAAATGYELSDVCFFSVHLFFLLKKDQKVQYFKRMPHELLPYHSPLNIDDKYELAVFLRKSGVAAPESYSITTEFELSKLPPPSVKIPYITKPQLGTRGRHTRLHHTNFESLREGFLRAKEISTRVVIQEELKGTVIRFTVIGGTYLVAGKREYPFVVGDGIHCIAELVRIENANPVRDGIFLRPLVFSEYEKSYVTAAGFSTTFVPPMGQRITISDKNSRRNGTVVEDITSDIHPTLRTTILKAAQLVASPVVGFDAIAEDYTQDIATHSFGIIECNSVPYIDVHHRVVSGVPHNVAAEIFKLL